MGDIAQRQVAHRQFFRRNASAPQAPGGARLLLFHRRLPRTHQQPNTSQRRPAYSQRYNGLYRPWP